MSPDGDGEITGSEFAAYFDETLPKESYSFDETIDQFMKVAEACGRRKKEAKRDHEPRREEIRSPPKSMERRNNAGGSRDEAYRRAVEALHSKQYEDAARHFASAAEKGHGEAAYKLGMMYQIGDKVPKNSAQALRFLTLAAEEGHEVVTPKLLNHIGELVKTAA